MLHSYYSSLKAGVEFARSAKFLLNQTFASEPRIDDHSSGGLEMRRVPRRHVQPMPERRCCNQSVRNLNAHSPLLPGRRYLSPDFPRVLIDGQYPILKLTGKPQQPRTDHTLLFPVRQQSNALGDFANGDDA
jgi:hypothetical protein